MDRTTEYRILILRDCEPYQAGDAENAEECAYIDHNFGTWGYVVESRDVAGDLHTDWELADSCFGFLGDDCEYMIEQARGALPAGVTAEILAGEFFGLGTIPDSVTGGAQ